jgi:YVTN family beta-propeller protein
MKLINLMFIILGLILLSCTQTEKVINPVSDSMKYFISVNSSTPQLKVVELPSQNVIYEDFFADVIKQTLTNPVENIKEFNGSYFIFVSKSYKIYIVKKSDLTLQTTIDFSDEQFEPTDIVFANSTDGYIVHRNSVYLTLLDLTNYVKARKVTVGNPPHQIAVSGNQILVTNLPDNTLSVVDSREKKEVEKIPTEPNPVFINITADEKTVVCVCAGRGKINISEEKSPAIIQYFNIETRKQVASQELGFAAISATDQNPQGLVVTPKDWGFIPTDANFLRADIRTKDKINLITKRFFYFINYDEKNSRLLLLREVDNRTDVMFADENSGDIGDFFSFPYKIKFVSTY